MFAQAMVKRTLVSVALILFSSPAIADAIDGDWCSPDGNRYFRISGPNVTSSAGYQTTGQYSRHAFSYVVPEGEPGAGDQVSMLLLNEDQVDISLNGGAAEMWHRCQLNV